MRQGSYSAARMVSGFKMAFKNNIRNIFDPYSFIFLFGTFSKKTSPPLRPKSYTRGDYAVALSA